MHNLSDSNPCTSRSEFWNSHIKKWQQSYFSKAEYCRRAGLSRYAFYYWCKKLGISEKDEAASPVNAVVPVSFPVVKIKDPKHEPLRLMIDRYRVDIPGDFNPEVLTKLIRTLEDNT